MWQIPPPPPSHRHTDAYTYEREREKNAGERFGMEEAEVDRIGMIHMMYDMLCTV